MSRFRKESNPYTNTVALDTHYTINGVFRDVLVPWYDIGLHCSGAIVKREAVPFKCAQVDGCVSSCDASSLAFVHNELYTSLELMLIIISITLYSIQHSIAIRVAS